MQLFFYILLAVLVLFTIIWVPFLIFFERRLLGVLQLRYGLFIYFFNAFFVFISDFLKILGKYNHFFFSYSFFLLYLSSIFFLLITTLILLIFPFNIYDFITYFFFPLFFLVCMSFIPFPFSLFIYFSNSIFSFIGNIRSILLLISYELVFDFWILILFILIYQNSVVFHINIFLFPICLILYITFLCDAWRVPFDLIEGESELVSGFNTELAFLWFLIVFFAEYIIFFFFIVFTWFLFNLYLSIVLFLYLFTRALLVRFFFTFIIYLFWFYYLFTLTFYFFYILTILI